MKAHRIIRNELKKLGIMRAISQDTTYNGCPVVLVRWNGQDEYVSTTHFGIGEQVEDEADLQYQDWLRKTYADVNLH